MLRDKLFCLVFVFTLITAGFLLLLPYQTPSVVLDNPAGITRTYDLVDRTRLRDMISAGKLSAREAMYYKVIKE